jgi:PQQ-dependent dehydrogenase (methanol/ethanol family)
MFKAPLSAVLALFLGSVLTASAQTPAARAQAPAAAPAQAEAFTQARTQFDQLCAGCHGAGGNGGDRAPSVNGTASLRRVSVDDIGGIIRNGTPRGMPGFASLPADQIARMAAWIKSNNQSGVTESPPEQVAAGERFFFGKGQCSNCHMVRGRGTANGPDLSSIAVSWTQADIIAMLDDPTSRMGLKRMASCPGYANCPDLQWIPMTVKMRDGTTLRGFGRSEAEHSLVIQTFDGRLHPLQASQYVSYTRDTQSYMPPLKASAEERRDLLAYLGSLGEPPLGPLPQAPAAKTPSAADKAAVITPRIGEWPSYNGLPSSNRHSPLDQINKDNVSSLQAKWVFAPGGNGLETTPIVADGIMYVTGAQQICALHAGTGLNIWCVPRASGQSVRAGGAPINTRPGGAAGPAPAQTRAAASRPSGGVASGNGPNRGAAILGDRIYFQTDDAYLVSVNRLTGGVIWTVPLTDPSIPGLYYSTSAPLVVGDLIVAGVSGGDTPSRGFLVAFDAMTGELAWRFWTVPAPGDPEAVHWKGKGLLTGGAATWMTGSYDPEAQLLYWGVGNPYPSNNGDDRIGSNIYANSIIALDPKTGKLKWHYQTTPHDLHDWDSTAPLVLVDARYQGRDRKLLMQANRNGFYYVLDRLSGELLFAKPFVDKMDWASGIDANGVPILLPDYAPTDEGHTKCPAVRGATNWFSTAFNPATRLFYVMAAEDCGYYRKTGRMYGPNPDAKDPGKRFVRALNPETGERVWEKPLTGSNEANYTGVLSTAGGLLFHGETAGGFAAVDAATGKTLWSFPTNESWRASPMTYTYQGKQYVAVAAGPNIVAFGLPN